VFKTENSLPYNPVDPCSIASPVYENTYLRLFRDYCGLNRRRDASRLYNWPWARAGGERLQINGNARSHDGTAVIWMGCAQEWILQDVKFGGERFIVPGIQRPNWWYDD